MTFLHGQLTRDTLRIGAPNSKSGERFFAAFTKINNKLLGDRIIELPTRETQDRMFLGHVVTDEGLLAPISPTNTPKISNDSYFLCYGIDTTTTSDINIAHSFKNIVAWKATDEFATFMSPLDGVLYADENGAISNTESEFIVGEWRASIKLLEVKINLTFEGSNGGT